MKIFEFTKLLLVQRKFTPAPYHVNSV